MRRISLYLKTLNYDINIDDLSVFGNCNRIAIANDNVDKIFELYLITRNVSQIHENEIIENGFNLIPYGN